MSLTSTRSPATPGSPGEPAASARLRPARWRDARVVVGLCLVLVSVAGVGLVVRSADDTVPVWVARTGLAPGMSVTDDDVGLERAQVPDAAVYWPADVSPVGTQVVRAVSAGQLLPVDAVTDADAGEGFRLVTLPVAEHNLPLELARGEHVDVYVVTRDAAGRAVGQPRLVLAAAAVDAVDDGGSAFGGSSLQVGVVLAVAAPEVADVLAASAAGSIVLVRDPGA